MKTYLVRVRGGDYDGYYNTVVFATTNKKIATKYCTKYNHILKKWKSYFKQFETSLMGYPWIEDDKPYWIFERWYKLRDIKKCYYEEVEMRQFHKNALISNFVRYICKRLLEICHKDD